MSSPTSSCGAASSTIQLRISVTGSGAYAQRSCQSVYLNRSAGAAPSRQVGEPDRSPELEYVRGSTRRNDASEHPPANADAGRTQRRSAVLAPSTPRATARYRSRRLHLLPSAEARSPTLGHRGSGREPVAQARRTSSSRGLRTNGCRTVHLRAVSKAVGDIL